MVAQTNHQINKCRPMKAEVVNLRMETTSDAKPHRVNLRSPLSRIHYYQNKRLQVKESQYLILTYS